MTHTGSSPVLTTTQYWVTIKCNKMQEVLEHVKNVFGDVNISKVPDGLKFNQKELGKPALKFLASLDQDVSIKRSGTGLVVLITKNKS